MDVKETGNPQREKGEQEGHLRNWNRRKRWQFLKGLVLQLLHRLNKMEK